MTTPDSDNLNLLGDLIGMARKAGADAADAVAVNSASLSVSCRLGRPEDLERSESRDIGLRVFIGRSQAIVSSSDDSAEARKAMIERAIAMARLTPEDPYCGLAPEDRLARDLPDLDLYDATEPDSETLINLAMRAEEAGRAVKGVTNSEGADASWSRHGIALVTSHGFSAAYRGSSFGLSASMIAGKDTGMERDYDFTSARHFADLCAPEEIGATAGERAVARLNPRKMPSCTAPVVFDRRVSASLLGHFSGAVNGSTVARGTSFLKDAMDHPVFSPAVTIIDDPHRLRGLRSKPFDGEGVANQPLKLVENGVLANWLLDSTSARQLNLQTNGRASRGTGSPPSPAPTNLYMQAGNLPLKALLADIASGFYVTELIGMGVNGVTGDYSRGAAGFWIENGEIAYPVSGMTIAGNLKDMFRQITPADDLEFRYGTNAPTLRIDGMTVAGD